MVHVAMAVAVADRVVHINPLTRITRATQAQSLLALEMVEMGGHMRVKLGLVHQVDKLDMVHQVDILQIEPTRGLQNR